MFYLNKDGKEIDFIIISEERMIPVEVKMKNTIAKTEINRLSAFLDDHKQDYALIFYSGESHVVELSGGKKVFCVGWV